MDNIALTLINLGQTETAFMFGFGQRQRVPSYFDLDWGALILIGIAFFPRQACACPALCAVPGTFMCLFTFKKTITPY